jgi:hypothetical protein
MMRKLEQRVHSGGLMMLLSAAPDAVACILLAGMMRHTVFSRGDT